MIIGKRLRSYNVRASPRGYCPATGDRSYEGCVIGLHHMYSGDIPLAPKRLFQLMDKWGYEYVGSYDRYPARTLAGFGSWYNRDRNKRYMFRRKKWLSIKK